MRDEWLVGLPRGSLNFNPNPSGLRPVAPVVVLKLCLLADTNYLPEWICPPQALHKTVTCGAGHSITPAPELSERT